MCVGLRPLIGSCRTACLSTQARLCHDPLPVQPLDRPARVASTLGALVAPAGAFLFVHQDGNQTVAMHEANHPQTKHLTTSVWAVDPRDLVKKGQRVGLAWFSPDCKHHSKAKGGKPVEKNIRDLAWVVVSWAELVKPDVIMLENVEEFQDWCPLTEDNKPDLSRKGETFL